MGKSVVETIDSWHEGVVAAAEVAWPPSSTSQVGVDHLIGETTPHAWNNAFAIMANRAVPRKREGCVTMNPTPLSGSTQIIGQYPYRHRNPDDGTVIQYHLLVGADGSLSWMDEAGTVTVLNADEFTIGEHFPSFSQLNNLMFICNGQERVKLRGVVIENFGIEKPTEEEMEDTTANAGAAGHFAGKYEVAFTYYNENTGHETSRSLPLGGAVPKIVSANFAQIDFTNLPQSSDPQVTHTRIYVRNIETQYQFYRVAEIADGTTSASVDIETTDRDLILIGPNLQENNPPPEGIKYLAAHKNRLFMADDGKLYWSKTGLPEAVDPNAYDLVHQDDGQKIRGIMSLPGGFLLILKEDSYYILEGDTPNIWSISRVGPAVGCLSHRSVVLGTDGVYWWAEQGPVRLGFSNLSTPVLIGYNRVSAFLTKRHVNAAERSRISAACDLTNQRILFSLPEAGQLRCTKMMVWSSRMEAWESDRWDPIDAASLATVNDDTSNPFVMIGGYGGQVFRLGVGRDDGVEGGTMVGTFVAAATSIQTITDVTADFDVAGAGLIERKLTILDANGAFLTKGIRPRITANTGTEITLSKPVSGLIVGATYTYVVGGPDWQFDTTWRDFGAPFDKKKSLHAYIHSMQFGHDMLVDIFRNQRSDTLNYEVLKEVEGEGALWNGFNWNDGTLWNAMELNYERIACNQSGITFALRFRNPYPNQPMQLLRMGFRAEIESDNLG